jgi:hypothetical protein
MLTRSHGVPQHREPVDAQREAHLAVFLAQLLTW